MKNIKLFEEFINETWKSGEVKWVRQEIDKIKKVNVNQRLKSLILSQGPFDAPFGDGGMAALKNKGLSQPFKQETNFGPETDALYYPIADKSKLEDVKNWILAYWDIAYKDFIKQVDKSKSNDLNFSSGRYSAPRQDSRPDTMVSNKKQSEPGASKKFAKQLASQYRRNILFQKLNSRFETLVGDCYSVATSPKEMEVICKQMGDELKKQFDDYINAIVTMNTSQQKHHAKFAKEIGHIKGEHKYVPREVLPYDPARSAFHSKYGAWYAGPERKYEFGATDKISQLPDAPGLSK